MIFTKPTLYPVPTPPPGRLSMMARPRGDDWLDDEMHSLRNAGVDVLVGLLTRSEAAELGLLDERLAATRAGLQFHALAIADQGVPEPAAARTLLDALHGHLTDGRQVVIHCRAGIGRSSLIAAGCLVRLGASTDTVWDTIAAARGLPVPETDEQRQWLDHL